MAYTHETIVAKGYEGREEGLVLHEIITKDLGMTVEEFAVQVFGSNEPETSEGGKVRMDNGAVRDNALMIQNILLDREYKPSVWEKIKMKMELLGVDKEKIHLADLQFEDERKTKKDRDSKYEDMVKSKYDLDALWHEADLARTEELKSGRAERLQKLLEDEKKKKEEAAAKKAEKDAKKASKGETEKSQPAVPSVTDGESIFND